MQVSKILGYTKIGEIEIRNGCFIGDSAIVLPNVTIGPNAMVRAEAVITKDVPAGMVVVGNPARVITSGEEYKSKISLIAKKKENIQRGILY